MPRPRRKVFLVCDLEWKMNGQCRTPRSPGGRSCLPTSDPLRELFGEVGDDEIRTGALDCGGYLERDVRAAALIMAYSPLT